MYLRVVLCVNYDEHVSKALQKFLKPVFTEFGQFFEFFDDFKANNSVIYHQITLEIDIQG